MNTLKLIAIALTITAINSGPVYADHGREVFDSNGERTELSSDTTPLSESKECCASCGAEVTATRSEEKSRGQSPVREWSFRDR